LINCWFLVANVIAGTTDDLVYRAEVESESDLYYDLAHEDSVPLT
jgi:hypothetical protein